MRRGDENDDEIPGGDSFMDIVANIVGILVLLVVVVGVRAGRDVVMPPEVISDDVEAIASLESKLEEQLRQVRREQSEIAQLTGKVASTLGEVERREAVREAAVLYNTKLRAELDEARNALSDDDQRSLQDHNEIAQAQLTLDRLTREQVALSAVEPAPEAKVVEVAPTPIVDGKVDQTISFRLQNDRLVYVPTTELTDLLRAKLNAPIVRSPTETVVTKERVGPVEGFVGEADIGWSVRSNGAQVAVRRELDRFVLREVTPLRGEEPEQALAPGGYVRSRIDLLDPELHVIEIFVYGDSFDTAPEVIQQLRERGFRVAQFLKAGTQPIVFSSNPSKSHQSVTQ